ncbi:hypothetical protein M9Y10_024475 [Tritrichomonas musculus]|uniref:CRAL-TRIO domain-containing protein n=1 Tax=Tritrichomonas musculus TaxID=1915356 RepID=A0ABR2HD05_9EUKA
MQFLPIHADLKFNPKTFRADDIKNIPDQIMNFIYVEWDNNEKAAKIKIFYPFVRLLQDEFEQDIKNLINGYAKINRKNLDGKIYVFVFNGISWKPQIYKFKKWTWERIADKNILIGDPAFLHDFMEEFLTLKAQNL